MLQALYYKSEENIMKITTLGLYIVMVIALVGCQADEPLKPAAPSMVDNTPDNYVECKDPRPEICTKQYDPVCAQKDTGVRCVTTPCLSTENITASNSCTACSDPEILGYIPSGACSE